MNKRPDNKKATDLEEFQEVEYLGENSPKNKKSYSASNVNQLSITPLHAIAIVAGGVIMLIGYLIFIYGHEPGGAIFEMRNYPRMGLALLISGISWLCILWGSRLKRRLGFIIATLLAGGLCYLPWQYKDAYKNIRYAEHLPSQSHVNEVSSTSPRLTGVDTKTLISNHLLELENLKQKQSDKMVTGLVIHQLPQEYLSLLEHYFSDCLGRKTKITSIEIGTNTNLESSYFISIISEKKDFQWSKILGFLDGQFKNNGQYYTLDIRPSAIQKEFETTYDPIQLVDQMMVDLKHLSRKRQEAALRFFATTDLLINAPEILQLTSISLSLRDESFQDNVMLAIANWRKLITDDSQIKKDLETYLATSDAHLIQTVEMALKNEVTPLPSIMNFLINEVSEGNEEIIFKAWKADPSEYERKLSLNENLANKLFKNGLTQLDSKQFRSANNILRKAGKKELLPILEKWLAEQKEETNKKSLRRTIDAIRNRP